MKYLPTYSRRLRWLLSRGALSLGLVLACVSPASASEPRPVTMAGSRVSSPPLAAWYHEFGRRDRVVQTCVVTGALALFVIMKKLAR